MFKRFTPSARQIVLVATEEARGLGHREIGPEHLLLGALRSGGASELALARLGLREGAVRARIGMMRVRGDVDEGAEISLSAPAVWAIAAGVRLADEDDEPQVGSGHILRALAGGGAALDVLAACGITATAVIAAVQRQPRETDALFTIAVAGLAGGDQDAAARALLAIVLRRETTVGAWLAERGVDESAVRRAFPALEPDVAAQSLAARRAAAS